jgi:hypothetical protein
MDSFSECRSGSSNTEKKGPFPLPAPQPPVSRYLSRTCTRLVNFNYANSVLHTCSQTNAVPGTLCQVSCQGEEHPVSHLLCYAHQHLLSGRLRLLYYYYNMQLGLSTLHNHMGLQTQLGEKLKISFYL